MDQVKLCECGCGKPTTFAPQTRTDRGWIKGQPIHFVHGHATRGRFWHGTCTVDGCGVRVNAHGLCKKHLARFERRGDVTFEWVGENVTNFVGDDATYRTLHNRLDRQRGKARTHTCVDCGRLAAQWSYDGTDPDERYEPKSGCPYSIGLDHYNPRCVSCHRRFDSTGRYGEVYD